VSCCIWLVANCRQHLVAQCGKLNVRSEPKPPGGSIEWQPEGTTLPLITPLPCHLALRLGGRFEINGREVIAGTRTRITIPARGQATGSKCSVSRVSCPLGPRSEP
jgi:hypothetical protein